MASIIQIGFRETPPVSITEAMKFIRADVDDESERSSVSALVAAAVDLVEDYTGRAISANKYRWQECGWPMWENANPGFFSAVFPFTRKGRPARAIMLPRSPLSSVQSVKYYDEANTLQVLSPSLYSLDVGSLPGKIVFKSDVDLPAISVADRANNLTIEFTAGGDTPDPVLVHAVKLLVYHFYDQRTPVVTGTIATEIPLSVRHLLRSRKVEYDFTT